MSDNKSSIGIKSTGENINWKYLNEERVDDPIINTLIKEAKNIFIDNIIENKNQNNNLTLNICIEYYNKYLKDNNIKYSFTLNSNSDILENEYNKKDKKQNKHGMKKENNKKDLMLKKIAEENIKKDMTSFINSLSINDKEDIPLINKKNIESFFVILNWGIYLLNKKKVTDIKIYLNCVISLYRAIVDCTFLTECLKNESMEIINKLENIIYSKLSESKGTNSIYNILLDNLILIIDSHWDIIKPKSVSLYNEQKDIISLVTSNLNNKIFVFYEMPPANGKTVLSAILAKIINNKNKENIKNIPNYKRKTLLYICYNTIVRNEVAKLCITHSLDVKYWLAVTMPDKETGKIKTFLRPYKNCYPDWNKKRDVKDQSKYDSLKWMRYSDNIFEQWKFYLNETRTLSEQIFDVKNFYNAENIPEMIISDLESAYTLLSNFPDTFITYFDEAFASASLEITSKIMSVLGHTVLVSATLATPDEIPTVINDFKLRHNHNDYNFIYNIKSSKQHISCTFIDESGYIFPPHNFISNIEELRIFYLNSNKPLIQRGYSPEVVFNISKIIDDDLPNELKFNKYFDKIGKINHESLRLYICNILKYIVDTNNEILLNKIRDIRILKIPNMNVNSIFTSSAYHYNNNKTLHVATLDGFNRHVEYISRDLLDNSPKISDIITIYNKEIDSIKKQLDNLERNGNKDSDFERNKLYKELDSIRLKWPSEYIVNSRMHSIKFETLDYLNNTNNDIFPKKDDLDIFSDIRTKMLFSGIGVYQPEEFSNQEMDYFLRKKDSFKFIISTPSIVYGTNISLSMIDIDKSFIVDSNKNTLYQLIGRAGRRGRSHSATIIFRDNDMLRIILNNDSNNREAQYIEENYKKILDKRIEDLM
jgi:hypothetical protein